LLPSTLALRGLCTTGAVARIDRDIASPWTREAMFTVCPK
jgi:hypothetical protein